MEGGKKTDKGETAETALFLVRHGADVTIKNSRGKTIADLMGQNVAIREELAKELAEVVE